MLTYIGGRLLQAVPVLFLTSILVFLLIRLVPGDPAITLAGQRATPEQVAALRHNFELDRPLVTQYVTWLGRLTTGDFGTSYFTNRPVAELVLQRVPATIHLAVGALVVMLTVGVPLGIFSAVRPRHPLTRVVAILNSLALATPTFWLGILLVLLFAVNLHWLPASGFASFTADPLGSVRQLVLPSLTLGAYGTAVLIRFLRSSILDVAHADFVRTANAKGLTERLVVGRHILRIALPPVVTMMAIQFGYLLGGAVITEAIFGWPGLGGLILDAINNQDYQIVQATMLLLVQTFIVINVLADVCYAVLDPRIRYAR
jgi:peptide/nickel transport system permease protein